MWKILRAANRDLLCCAKKSFGCIYTIEIFGKLQPFVHFRGKRDSPNLQKQLNMYMVPTYISVIAGSVKGGQFDT